MGTIDSNGIYFYEDTDSVSPLHTLLNVGQQSVSDALTGTRLAPLPASNATTRASIYAALIAAGRDPAAYPVYIDQLDTDILWRNDGSGWIAVSANSLNAGTTGVLAGSAPPARTSLIAKSFYGQTTATNGSGITTITFPGGGFPNGVVSAQVNLARADGTAQSAYVLQVGACTLTAIDVRVAGLLAGNFAFISGASPYVSLLARGW